MDSTGGLDPDLDRWLHRLPLAERLEIQRREEQQQGWKFKRTGINNRCSVCVGYLRPEDLADPLKRCATCRKTDRKPERVRAPKWDRRRLR